MTAKSNITFENKIKRIIEKYGKDKYLEYLNSTTCIRLGDSDRIIKVSSLKEAYFDYPIKEVARKGDPYGMYEDITLNFDLSKYKKVPVILTDNASTIRLGKEVTLVNINDLKGN